MPDGLTYFDGEDPSDDDEDEDDEDDEQPPQAIPLGSKRRAALMAVGLVVLSLASHESDECLRIRCSEPLLEMRLRNLMTCQTKIPGAYLPSVTSPQPQRALRMA